MCGKGFVKVIFFTEFIQAYFGFKQSWGVSQMQAMTVIYEDEKMDDPYSSKSNDIMKSLSSMILNTSEIFQLISLKHENVQRERTNDYQWLNETVENEKFVPQTDKIVWRCVGRFFFWGGGGALSATQLFNVLSSSRIHSPNNSNKTIVPGRKFSSAVFYIYGSIAGMRVVVSRRSSFAPRAGRDYNRWIRFSHL
jgi:hypothetical protein